MPLRKIPSFTSIARLDIPFSSLIEVLPWLGRQKSGTAGRGIVSGGWEAPPRHRKFLVATWVGLRRHHATPVHPISAGLQSPSVGRLYHLLARGTNCPRANSPCC